LARKRGQGTSRTLAHATLILGKGKTVVVFAIVVAAFVLATGLSLVVRPLLVVGLGIGLFIAAGSWQATASDEGAGETPHGVAGFWLAAIWILLPWLVGVGVGRLIASTRCR
jgi:hypothetical protein